MSLTRKRLRFIFLFFATLLLYYVIKSYVFRIMFFSSELQNFDYEFDAVKEEADVQVIADDGKAGSIDHMYMKVKLSLTIYFYHITHVVSCIFGTDNLYNHLTSSHS